jgi:putative nucleotidyltransferase with HDIG domain
MLSRITVVGKDPKLLETLCAAAKNEAVQINAIAVGEAVPHGTSAIMATENEGMAALEAALTVCKGHEALLGLLADAVASREGIALGSSQRVRRHAARFAEALQLTADEQLVLERGALLRDIGKVKIHNDVLLKLSVLSYDDWILLQQHTHLGATLLEERNVGADVLDIVRYHHECYDGDGYPDNLEGEAIPYFARIIKIVDVYCAMTSPRHYRKTQTSHEDALAYLKSERGKHYDPELMDVFVNAEIGRPVDTGELTC